jgi:hypothetical protein
MGRHFWIGANDIDIEDDWIWESDKSKLLYSDWHGSKISKTFNRVLENSRYE